MKRSILFLTLLLSAFSLFSKDAFIEIEDTSSLSLLNPDFSERKTLKLELKNGLKLFLISDPNADESAASVSVEAGSWNDPEEYPGMAHFCEHMLFMGTQKYPSENAFFQEITNFGGAANAFTAPHRTVYMFSCQEEGFLPLLDRFAHFFIDPLFKPENIQREMHAVDQEFSKSLENDFWRSYMVWKETGNQNHPNKMFSCGNSQTLSTIPQSALKSWHETHYSANQIHVVLYSSLPLDLLKQEAISSFSQVPISQSFPEKPSMPLTSNEQKGHITYIEPIQNRQLLTLSWELPPSLAKDPSHPAELVAYALNRGQKKSLYQKLKKERLIDAMLVEVDEAGGKEYKLFQIHLELTDEGIHQIEKVGLYTFEALSLLKSTGVPLYLFEEKNHLKTLNYQYQSREDAFTTIRKIGESLADEPLTSFPRQKFLAESFSPEKVESVLSLLTPQNGAYTLLAPLAKSEIAPSKKEKWMGAQYTIQPISPTWIKTWEKATPNPEISLAPPNPFIPTELHLIKEKRNTPFPEMIGKGEFGKAYYIRASEFEIPELNIHLHLASPLLNPSAKSQVLTSLYLDHLTDELHPMLQTAKEANIGASFSLSRSKLHLNLYGFSEKAPLLLQEILKEMPLNPPSKEQFSIYFERHKKGYLNAEKELAFKQGKDLLESLLNQDKVTSQEKLEALEKIDYEAFLHFHKNLFEENHIEALFSGNISEKNAQSSWLDMIHTLGKKPFPEEEHYPMGSSSFPDTQPFMISETIQAQGNATFLVIDQGDFTFEKRAAQEVLAQALGEAFFNELRTKQKTGYLASSNALEKEGRLFELFVVQSNSHQTDDLLYRFELFLEEYVENFSQEIPLQRFETLKKSAVASLKNRFRSLKDKTALWNLLAFEKEGDFQFIEKRVEALENLSYESFTAFSKETLSRKNKKRLAILMNGKIPHPFAYEQTDKSAFLKLSRS